MLLSFSYQTDVSVLKVSKTAENPGKNYNMGSYSGNASNPAKIHEVVGSNPAECWDYFSCLFRLGQSSLLGTMGLVPLEVQHYIYIQVGFDVKLEEK